MQVMLDATFVHDALQPIPVDGYVAFPAILILSPPNSSLLIVANYRMLDFVYVREKID